MVLTVISRVCAILSFSLLGREEGEGKGGKEKGRFSIKGGKGRRGEERRGEKEGEEPGHFSKGDDKFSHSFFYCHYLLFVLINRLFLSLILSFLSLTSKANFCLYAKSSVMPHFFR